MTIADSYFINTISIWGPYPFRVQALPDPWSGQVSAIFSWLKAFHLTSLWRSHRFGLLPGRLMAFEEILIKLLEGDAMADQGLPTLGLVSL